jgi:hypothetical protein
MAASEITLEDGTAKCRAALEAVAFEALDTIQTL